MSLQLFAHSNPFQFIILPQSSIFTGLYWVLAQCTPPSRASHSPRRFLTPLTPPVHSCSFLAVLNAQAELVGRMAGPSRGRRAASSPVQFTTALEPSPAQTGPQSADAFELSEFAPRSSGSDLRRGGLEPQASGSGERPARPRAPGEMVSISSLLLDVQNDADVDIAVVLSRLTAFCRLLLPPLLRRMVRGALDIRLALHAVFFRSHGICVGRTPSAARSVMLSQPLLVSSRIVRRFGDIDSPAKTQKFACG